MNRQIDMQNDSESESGGILGLFYGVFDRNCIKKKTSPFVSQK